MIDFAKETTKHYLAAYQPHHYSCSHPSSITFPRPHPYDKDQNSSLSLQLLRNLRSRILPNKCSRKRRDEKSNSQHNPKPPSRLHHIANTRAPTCKKTIIDSLDSLDSPITRDRIGNGRNRALVDIRANTIRKVADALKAGAFGELAETGARKVGEGLAHDDGGRHEGDEEGDVDAGGDEEGEGVVDVEDDTDADVDDCKTALRFC